MSSDWVAMRADEKDRGLVTAAPLLTDMGSGAGRGD